MGEEEEVIVVIRQLHHGDNLEGLRSLSDGSVDLIATDPPFNKGYDFHGSTGRFRDSWSHEDMDQLDHPGACRLVEYAEDFHSRGMASYLCWLAVRLVEMRRVLKSSGSIYLHCDTSANYYIRLLMDQIFGKSGFRNEIVWNCGRFLPNPHVKKFIRGHDTILFHAGSGHHFVPTHESHLSDDKRRIVDRGWNVVDRLTKPELPGGGNKWDTGKFLYVYDEGKLVEAESEGLMDRRDYDRVKFCDPTLGNQHTDVWDIAGMSSYRSEYVGYPTQKPLALYARIIEASSRPGDVVLDPFCGSCTTLIAAERAGRQWIGMDLWPDGLHDVIRGRLHSEMLTIGDESSGWLFSEEVEYIRYGEALVR